MADDLIGIAFFAWAPFLSALVGVLYFASSSTAAPLGQRALASAYAPAVAVIYLMVAFASAAFREAYLSAVYPVAWVVPLGLLALSLFRYPGPRWAHFVLLPLAALAIAWQGVWSYFGVYGK
nr:hypothetical protein [uncultured Roseateles sp.]